MGRFSTIEDTKYTLEGWLNNLLYKYYRSQLPKKVREVRSKDKIRVLFLISELGPWKTESLFSAMLEHDRFAPVIGVFKSVEDSNAYFPLTDYLNKKGYGFVDVKGDYDIRDVNPDIIFYQKPYMESYPERLFFGYHLNSLFCYVGYAFNSMDLDWAVNLTLYDNAWQIYYENELAASTRRLVQKNGGRNLVITGLPIQDALSKSKDSFQDNWRCDSTKKRIIYAPHHTISDFHNDGIGFSTFIENGEFMLEMKRKYSGQVYWAFKPHPLLYSRLIQVWGKEKTDAYYKEWTEGEDSQFENGAYIGLFKHSHAMIHDCSSFTIEYHYTQNPVLYLVREANHSDSLNNFANRAYDLHYKAKNHEEIEQFISNVINDNDPLENSRKKFYDDCLLPPNGMTACENIINAILGVGNYKSING